jgi:hypothetical protein
MEFEIASKSCSCFSVGGEFLIFGYRGAAWQGLRALAVGPLISGYVAVDYAICGTEAGNGMKSSLCKLLAAKMVDARGQKTSKVGVRDGRGSIVPVNFGGIS